MNFRKLMQKYIVGIYLIILIMSITLSISGIAFYSKIFKYICYSLYFIISVFSLRSLYLDMNNRLNKISIFVLPFLFLGILFVDKILAVPFILVIIVLFAKKDYLENMETIYMFLYAFIILVGVIGFSISNLFGDFGEEKIERTYYSLDQKKKISVISVDLGATGGGVKVLLQKTYLGLLKIERNVYVERWGETPYIRWIDNDSVQIEDQIIKIK